MVQLNVVSLVILTKLLAKEMVERERGKILNVASTAAFQPGPLMAIYYATKAFVLSFSEALAEELKESGVTVTALCPGPTATGFSGAIPSAETKAERARKIPLGRMCEAEDIADPILFLAGHAARMITGVALTVDGGVLVKNDTPYEEYFGRRSA